jgi:hypothetical protein
LIFCIQGNADHSRPHVDAYGLAEFQSKYFFALEMASNLIARILSDLWRIRVDDTDMVMMTIGFLFRQSL